MLKTGTDRNRGVPSSDQVPALTNVTPGCSEIWREAGAASAVCGLSPAQGMPTVPDLVLGSALLWYFWHHKNLGLEVLPKI